jgi:hypothetical protein
MIRATNAKEVAVENGAEETFRRPNQGKRVRSPRPSQVGNRTIFEGLVLKERVFRLFIFVHIGCNSVEPHDGMPLLTIVNGSAPWS